MPDIFISYSHADRDHARRFAERLRATGLDVWWDDALRGGQAFDHEIEEALRGARAVIVLWSSQSVTSRWVRSEAALAQDLGTVLPVTIEPCSLPVMFTLTHTVDMAGWDGSDSHPAWQSFLDDLDHVLAGEEAAAQAAPAPPPPAAGTRREVAVLSMVPVMDGAAHAAIDPEDWQDLLAGFQKDAAAVIEAEGGDLRPSVGGAIVGFFGSGRVHEDDALRATRAAADIRTRAAKEGNGLTIQAGVEAGLLVLRGGEAFGPVIETAERLRLHAEPGTILVGPVAAHQIAGYAELEAASATAFRLKELQSDRSRFDISRLRGLSRFVGRENEMTALERGLERASLDGLQVIGVVGDAGSGKSRLCFEFMTSCRAQGVLVAEGRATSASGISPYAPIVGLFHSLFGVLPDETPEEKRRKITAWIEALDPDLVNELPSLFAFMRVSDPAVPPLPMDAGTLQRRVLAIFRHALAKLGRESSIVVYLEDLHWLDDASGQFLERLLDAEDIAPVLVLASYRPEFEARWLGSSRCRQLALRPLGSGAIDALLSDLLGMDESVAALGAKLQDASGGNPFFLEEIVRSLAQAGQLTGERGAYVFAGSVDAIEIPGTVRALLTMRIARLPEMQRRLLQIAAIAGKQFSEPLVAEVSRVSESEAAAALSALVRLGFTSELSLVPYARYTFVHPLTLEMAAASLLKAEARDFHREVARVIERRHADRIEEFAPELARHYQEAGDALVAAEWHRRAAEWVSHTDFGMANGHWLAIRELVRDLDEEPAAIRLHLSACIQMLYSAHQTALSIEEAQAILAEGDALADRTGNPTARLMLSSLYARVIGGTGDAQGYLELARRNHALAASSGSLAAEASTHLILMDALAVSSHVSDALDLAEQGVEKFAGLDRDSWPTPGNPVSFCHFQAAVNLMWSGRVKEALERFDLCCRMGESDGTPEVLAWTHWMAGITQSLIGNPEAAHRHADALAAISDKAGSSQLAAFAHTARARAQLAEGDAEAALASARQAVAIFKAGERLWLGIGEGLVAEALLEGGHLAEAIDAGRTAVRTCRAHSTRQSEVVCLGILARARMRHDGVASIEETRDLLLRAEQLVEESGARFQQAMLKEWRAELSDLEGNRDAAARLREEAADLHETFGHKGRARELRMQAA
ncbi:AAA family ATPase [Qipengyuania sp. 6B39]|uniref:AAA family ATPase n=1 Tax=Qipengyuania proteolytica TaxID=2867239 RepID=UPI001C8A9599|nr:AAA family ATPase [Qipengyuania proteolytica]